ELRVTTARGAAVEVWLNGKEVTPLLAADAKESARRSADVRQGNLPPGDVGGKGNVLAVSVRPQGKAGGLLFDAGLYVARVPRAPGLPPDAYEPTLIRQRAVVCDLCGTLPSGPACVSACPHEATQRFDAPGGIVPW